MMRVAGFPRPGPGDRVLDEQVAGLAAGMAAAEAVFGEDAVLQLVRLMGSKAAQRHRAGWNEATSVARNGANRDRTGDLLLAKRHDGSATWLDFSACAGIVARAPRRGFGGIRRDMAGFGQRNRACCPSVISSRWR